MTSKRNALLRVFGPMLIVLTVGVRPLAAQEEDQPPNTTRPPAAGEQSPSILSGVSSQKDLLILLYDEYLKDALPDRVVVPLKTWEHYQRLVAEKKSQQVQWAVTRFALNGQLGENWADLEAEVDVSVNAEDGALVDLELSEASLHSATDEQGRRATVVVGEKGGYQLLVDEKGQYRFKLGFYVPIERGVQHQQLVLTLPVSGTKSVVLNGANPFAWVEDARTQSRLDTLPNASSIRPPLRPDDSIDLAWRYASPLDPAPVAGHQVNGVLSYRLANSSLEVQARLQIELGRETTSVSLLCSATEEVNSVRVQREGEAVAASFESETRDGHRVILVEFTEPVSGPVQITVIAHRERFEVGVPVTVGQWEVTDADSQSGYLLFSTADDRWVRYRPKRGLQPIELAELNAELQREQPARAFRYNSQPTYLEFEVNADPHVAATSQSELVVESDQILLTTKMRFQIRQAPVDTMEIQLPSSLQLYEVGPLDLVRSEEINRGTNRVLRVNLTEPTTKPVEITISGAFASTPGEAVEVEFPKPEKVARWSGTVSIQPRPNVGLTLNEGQTRNLVRERITLDQDGVSKWLFRQRPGVPVLAILPELLAQALHASCNVTLTLTESVVAVSERLDITALHEPLQRLRIPLGQVVQDVKVTGTDVTSTADEQGLNVLFGAPAFRQVLVVEYRVPSAAQVRTIPLLRPDGVQVSTQSGTIHYEPGTTVFASDPWFARRTSTSDAATSPTLQVSCPTGAEEIKLRVEPNSALATLVVSRVLNEEALNSEGRRRGRKHILITRRRTRRLQLDVPEGCRIISIAVNGEPAGIEHDPRVGSGVQTVALPADDGACSVEVDYDVDASIMSQWLGNLTHTLLRTPRIADDAAIQQARWVLYTRTDHLLMHFGSGGWVQKPWRWVGYLLPPPTGGDRSEVMGWLDSDAEADWSSNLEPLYAGEARRWVLDSSNPVVLDVWTVPLTFWILLCSGPGLVFGLALSRSGTLVQARGLAAFAAAFLILAAVHPTLTRWMWMGAQWGVYLGLAALLLRAAAVRRRRRRYPVATTRYRDRSAGSLSTLLKRLRAPLGPSAPKSTVSAADGGRE